MTDIASVLQAAERELRASGTVDQATCQALAQADDAERVAVAPAFAFLGCGDWPGETGDVTVPLDRRVEAVRLMLLKLGAQTDAPRWSSHVLDRLFQAALRPTGAEIGDIVRALFALFGELPGPVTQVQANLVREFSVRLIGLNRRAYAAQDFSWLASALSAAALEATPAQAFLAAAVLPIAYVPQCRDAIMRSLQGSEFAAQVARDLAD